MDNQYQPPVVIYVVWHPDFEAGAAFADSVFRQFCRDASEPLLRQLGIPVFFRSERIMAGGAPLPIHFTEAAHSVVIALIDDHFLVDDAYRAYLTEIALSCSDPTQPHRLVPVSVSAHAAKLPKVNRINFVILEAWQEGMSPEKSAEWLKANELILYRKLSSELCRLLIHSGVNAVALGGDLFQSPAQMRFFLSYARRDGIGLVEEVQAFVATTTSHSTYLDSLSIAVSYDFEKEIKAGVISSMMVVFLTDVYASREWCRKEVLLAKENNRPILVVNAMNSGETRSFPYLGNVPTIRWSSDPHVVLDAAVFEALRHFYHDKLLGHMRDYFEANGLLTSGAKTMPSAPELLTLSLRGYGKDPATILYPDPPLGREELDVLNLMNDQLIFVTPNCVAGLSVNAEAEPLLGRKIAVSISEPDGREMFLRGFGKMRLRDSLIEFFRYIFAGGGRVVYGGHLEEDSFTTAIISLANEYKGRTDGPPFLGFLAWPFHNRLTVKLRAQHFGLTDFKQFSPDPALGLDLTKALPNFGPAEHLGMAMSLCNMRAAMAETEDARVLMGGKTTGFLGFYPGLLEETWRSMQAGKPVFLLGAWGGCAGAIAEMLETGITPPIFTDAVLKGGANQKALWAERGKYEGNLPGLDGLPDSAEEMARDIIAAGIAGLSNGLDAEENRRLFRTVHVPEMVGLVLKGLGGGK